MSALAAAGVLAVVPAHNEAPRIGAVVRGLLSQGLPVLVVDDGSSDGTGSAAEAAGAGVLRLDPNQGKGAALKAGFRAALGGGEGEERTDTRGAALAGRIHGAGPTAVLYGTGSSAEPRAAAPEAYRWEAILTLDGDGQHDPAEVPAFLEAWKTTGADLVVGARDYRSMPPVRYFTNSLSRRLLSWALGETVPDNQSGYRLRSRRLAEAGLSSPEKGFAFEVEEIAICVGRGWKLAWVPIKTIYSGGTSHIRPWTHFVSFARVTRRARERMKQERRRE